MKKALYQVPFEQALATSPCVGNCCLDLDDICLGCQRHISEITGWHQADQAQRKVILQRCAERRIARSN
ncbi:DUF1289 domain-containing protein [Alteromonas lipolytica]|uniref:Fe-S protein n=1 Tax=Alteromonas lipolytica TaxID=1856405 RepID=A0A1E8FF21_9ALTE|nr:DUF1289 domain-containing protein [Alteromonas lipolytica]OFI34366.1 hypothetical protein BFC17_18450 [Alteromonas lipolytica]GGF82109.1 hypothetical protein GCM10011338_37950 [Alteromonas lipolytica]